MTTPVAIGPAPDHQSTVDEHLGIELPALPGGPSAPAPPSRPPMPDPDPENAPLGYVWRNGEWVARKPPGRPRKAVKAPRKSRARGSGQDGPGPGRTAAPKAPPVAEREDFRPVLTEFGQALWFIAATMPLPNDVTVLGRHFAGVRVRARVQAAVIEQNLPNLVQVGQVMADHSPAVQAGLRALAAGAGGSWLIPALVYVVPFALQTFSTWHDKLDDAAEDIAMQVEQQAAQSLAEMSKVATSS